MITHEESIKLLKRYGNDQENVMELYKVIEDEISDLKHDYMRAISIGAKIQVELNELKKDVARFMVLLNIYLTDTQTIEEMHERWALERKLSKVGKE